MTVASAVVVVVLAVAASVLLTWYLHIGYTVLVPELMNMRTNVAASTEIIVTEIQISNHRTIGERRKLRRTAN